MVCEICGAELDDDTTSTIDEHKCRDCAPDPDADEDDEENSSTGDFSLDDDDFEMNVDL